MSTNLFFPNTTTPTIKRAKDFNETHEYIVTFPDGKTTRIYRDTHQFGYGVWHEVNSDAIFGLGHTREEAIETLLRNRAAKGWM